VSVAGNVTAPVARVPRSEIAGLIDLAADSLLHMRSAADPGVFCFELRRGDPVPHGRSLRYTLMALLGLRRAQTHGHAVGWSLDATEAALERELGSPELDPGDYGLYLWDDARAGAGRGDELVSRLEDALASRGGLRARLGMELGWIVTGLAHHVAAGGGGAADALLARALEQLLTANRAPSGLFRHSGTAGMRRRFPNFATQIYSVLALATVARHGLDARAAGAARAAADRLLELQLPDGGWPWLYDADRGTVVERYEIYCVHQHAMAPMGLLELAEVTGDDRYTRAVARGLPWIWGHNELGRDMVEPEHHMVLRSVRRRRGPDRLWPAAKTVAALAGLPARGSTARATEVDPTDRPYSMGWILEAWSGREDVLER
jgi:hypothetical protein